MRGALGFGQSLCLSEVELKHSGHLCFNVLGVTSFLWKNPYCRPRYVYSFVRIHKNYIRAFRSEAYSMKNRVSFKEMSDLKSFRSSCLCSAAAA